jgi:hypothetical protein
MPVSVSRWVYAPHEAAHANGSPIDPGTWNAATIGHIEANRKPGSVIVVVPGFTPVGATTPVALHPTAIRRLEAAVEAAREHRALGILVSGGNVHPDKTPYNEAWEMRRHLLEVLHHPAEQVILEPYARHSTTNIRNAGRFLRAHGLDAAIVVTDLGQGFYFGFPVLSSFHLRCDAELGYRLGTFSIVQGLSRIRYEPAPEVERRGTDPLDP